VVGVLAIPKQLKHIRYNIVESDDAVIAPKSPIKYKRPTDAETEAALEQWVAFARRCSVISSEAIVKFDPYEFQKDVFRAYWQHSRLIVGKPRQHGLTETLANIFLWQASENPAFSAAIFSKNDHDTGLVAVRVRRMAISTGIKTSKANSDELCVDGGGTILFRNSKPDNARGLASLTAVLIDEAAFIPKVDDIWLNAGSAQELLGPAAKAVIISTPPPPEDDPSKVTFYMRQLLGDNGDRDVVKIANQMRAGEIAPVQRWTDDSGAAKFLVHWRAHPIYSQREDHLGSIIRRLNVSPAACNREHDLAFDERLDTGIVNMEWFGGYSPIDLPGKPVFVLQSWDTASSVSKGSSYSAGLTLMLEAGMIYIVDMVHDQMLSPDVEAAVRSAADKWRPNLILIEDKSSGIHIIPNLVRDSFFPYSVKPIQPYTIKGEAGNAKLLRFEQELPVIRDARRVLIPSELKAPAWRGVFVSAISKVGIPNAPMDVGDALSQALKYLREDFTGRSGRSPYGIFGGRIG
jgi:phage terminase large subunit-like protein